MHNVIYGYCCSGSELCCAPSQHQKNPLFGDFSVEMHHFIPWILLGFNLSGNCGAETSWVLQDHSLKDLGEISFRRREIQQNSFTFLPLLELLVPIVAREDGKAVGGWFFLGEHSPTSPAQAWGDLFSLNPPLFAPRWSQMFWLVGESLWENSRQNFPNSSSVDGLSLAAFLPARTSAPGFRSLLPLLAAEILLWRPRASSLPRQEGFVCCAVGLRLWNSL